MKKKKIIVFVGVDWGACLKKTNYSAYSKHSETYLIYRFYQLTICTHRFLALALQAIFSNFTSPVEGWWEFLSFSSNFSSNAINFQSFSKSLKWLFTHNSTSLTTWTQTTAFCDKNSGKTGSILCKNQFVLLHDSE